ncbi:MAG: hypothetical protein OEY29_16065 [Gammaproteobacteria bacterium]|nr:hypothetical protein [Gammaproteobacteria bacterium]
MISLPLPPDIPAPKLLAALGLGAGYVNNSHGGLVSSYLIKADQLTIYDPSISLDDVNNAVAALLQQHGADQTQQRRDNDRSHRDQLIRDAAALLDRHRNQLEFGLTTTLTAQQAQDVALYIEQLRQLGSQIDMDAELIWPPLPVL